jgi:hypothetical protein
MKPATEQAYRRWQIAATKGYGETTSPTRMKQIDATIRRLKTVYERLLWEETPRMPQHTCHLPGGYGTCPACPRYSEYRS